MKPILDKMFKCNFEFCTLCPYESKLGDCLHLMLFYSIFHLCIQWILGLELRIYLFFSKIFRPMPPQFFYFYLFSREATSMSESVLKVSVVDALSFCVCIVCRLSRSAQSAVTMEGDNYSFGEF